MNLHLRAKQLVQKYFRVEAELVDVLQKIDDQKLYREFEVTSLFAYATKILGLTESVALNFISVARATKKVPELKKEIEAGTLSVSKAKHITSVLTPENQSEWILKAKSLSKRQLEKEVARVAPKAATPDKASYVTDKWMKLELGVPEEFFEKLKRVQDLESQSAQKPVSMLQALQAAVKIYLQKKDLGQKPERKTKTKLFPGRVATKRLIYQRHQGQCTAQNPDGSRCTERRWLDIHHLIPRAQGGPDTIENLILLCRGHHHLHHSHHGLGS